MSTIVGCSGCGKRLTVRDEHLGRRLKCPQCNEIFTAAAPVVDRNQQWVDKLGAQWPGIVGIICIVLGLVIVIQTRHSVVSRYTLRLGFAVLGVGVASLGYWALSSSNRDYNF
jgi:hypothetical protein